MSSPEHSEFPVIGKDISWDELAKHNRSGLLRAIGFLRLASVEGDKVKAMSLTMPYGVLTVECLELKSSFAVHITHKIDFLHVWHAYELCENSKSREILLQNRAEDFKSWSGRDDFMSIYSRVWNTRETEIIVARFSTPQKGLRKLVRKASGAVLPSLVVAVFPKGFLERVVCGDWEELDGIETSAMAQPLVKYEPPI